MTQFNDTNARTQEQPQYIFNLSYDQIHKLLMTGLLAYNPSETGPDGNLGRMDRVQIDDATGGLLVKTVGGGAPSSTVAISQTGTDNNVHEVTGLMPKVFDAITYTATSSTIDTYKYYTSGTGGTLVATLTVTFTAADHLTLVSVVRT